MTEKNKETVEYINPYRYIKDEDVEQNTVTGIIGIEKSNRRKIVIALVIGLLIISITFWVLFEWLGYWLINCLDNKISYEPCLWLCENLPIGLLGNGFRRARSESVWQILSRRGDRGFKYLLQIYEDAKNDPNGDNYRELILINLYKNGTNRKLLKGIVIDALNDPSEFVRSVAIKILEKEWPSGESSNLDFE